MQTLRIVPDVRSSVVEEMPAGQVLLFTSQRGDIEPQLLAHPAVHPFSWPRLLRALRDPDLELIEVAEPLWLGEWVRALRHVALARLLRPRRRVAVATYAIENLDARERCRFPSLDAHPRLGAVVSRVVLAAVGLSVRALDVVVFGTSGAAENYRRAFGRSLRARHTVLTPRLGPCRVCGPVPAGVDLRDRTVLFLGTPSERKGFGVLTDAWERSGAAGRGWRLVVADPSGDVDRPVPPGVAITTPTRREVHELLRRSAVVAMPSVRRRRWREQIGLPLVEGLAHGCRVVTTTETGLADDLRGHPLVTLTTPGDAADLAEGLRRATEPGPRPDTAAPPAGWTKRDVVAWWLDARATAAP
ncbi:hypothetical protein GCM10023200_36260 [Actinomycetospora chlora]|uniref:Glycosyltransferase n=1 Tax=Actinomycetospora chlora TaxID=663608 RepID=A0ABP9BL63_9PSEU